MRGKLPSHRVGGYNVRSDSLCIDLEPLIHEHGACHQSARFGGCFDLCVGRWPRAFAADAPLSESAAKPRCGSVCALDQPFNLVLEKVEIAEAS